MGEGMIFAMGGFIMLLGLIGLIALVWVIYDVLVNQKEMSTGEKVLWILIALILGLIGAIIYYFVVKRSHKYE